MSMVKVAPPGAWDFGLPQVQRVKIASDGLKGDDFRQLVKRAGYVFADAVKKGDWKKDETPVHLIALGATEWWGCFAAGTPIAMEDGRYVSVERVAEGDIVLSAEGRGCPVSAVFQRPVESGLQLDVSALPDPLVCSIDHPFRVARKEQFVCDHDKYKRCLPPTQGRQNICQRTQKPRECVIAPYREITVEWGRSDSLREGDFLVWTAPQIHPELDMGVDEAYLLGAWLVEGHFQRGQLQAPREGGEPRRLIFSLRLSVGPDEHEFIDKIRTCAARCGFTSHLYDRVEQKSMWAINIQGHPARVRSYHAQFGEHAAGKRLPPWTCGLSREARLSLVAGYYDGDGHFAVSHKENRATARTISRELALGVQRVIWSLGCPATVCTVRPEPGFAQGYNVSFPTGQLPDLAVHSWKFKSREPDQTSKVHGFAHRNRMYLPVRNIQAVTTPFAVYNIEVEGDHTYSGPNVDSHNCNRNGDGFRDAVCQEYHPTFVKHAYAFRDHANKRPEKSYGLVKYSHHNPDMHRVELLITLNATKSAADRNGGLVADQELEDLEKDGSYPVSMACTVPFDICSVCNNKARFRDEYCRGEDEGGSCPGGGLFSKIATVLADGTQVYADNPNPRWFDISRVPRPACRTAYTLGVVKAATAAVLGGAALAEAWGVSAPWAVLADGSPAVALAARLAELEKQADAGRLDPVWSLAFIDPSEADWSSHGGSPAEASTALAMAKVALPVEGFIELYSGDHAAALAVAPDVRRRLPGVFGRMLADGDVEKMASDPAFAAPTGRPAARVLRWAEKIASAYSLERKVLRNSVFRAGLTRLPAPLQKSASAGSLAVETLARAYAAHQLAFLRAVEPHDPDFALTCEAMVQSNHARRV